MKKMAYLLITLLFIGCGSKSANDKKGTGKDTVTTTTGPDSSSRETKMSDTHTPPVITDTNQVYTDTEILNEKGQLDPNSSPLAVVQTIIKAAKTGNYGPLLKLSNPAIEMDGDAKDIINVPNKSKEDQKEFNDYFGNAKIMGKPRIKKNLAEVDIETTAEGGDKETIICENKFDKWYLKGL